MPWSRVLGLLSVLAVITTVSVLPTAATGPSGSAEHRAVCVTNAAGYCSVRHKLGVAPTDVKVRPLTRSGQATYPLSVVPGSQTIKRFRVRALHPDGRPQARSLIRFVYWLPGTPGPQPTTTTTTTTTSTRTSAPPPPAPAPTTSSSVPTPPSGRAGAVCGSSALNGGPASPPAGAVTVPAGNNANVDFGKANTTYWFAPGVHTLGGGAYAQIIPGDNATFVGAPGAILDGQKSNQYAFTQHASNVKIRYLTMRNFVAPQNEGVVNHDSGNGWVIEHNTMTNNKGAAMMSGARQVMRGNCLKDNGQYGLNAYKAGNTITDIVLEGNEFVGNNTDNWEEQIPGCGCTGAMKFWAVDGADIRQNWIHHNHGSGIWADTNDNDFLIEDNLIEANEDHAIFYEISYNAVIRDNVIRDNAWHVGQDFAADGDSFPIGAIYLSEAGGESRVPARTTSVEVSGNVFQNNWGGIVGWENSDRFCNSPASTTDDCTELVGPANTSRCSPTAIKSEPMYSDCRWKTKRLDIHHNQFRFDPAQVAGGCPAKYCGRMALFANYGSYPDWSPYKGRVIQEAITFKQTNRWHDNSYTGPWKFTPYDTGRVLTFAQWQAAPYHQDTGSTG